MGERVRRRNYSCGSPFLQYFLCRGSIEKADITVDSVATREFRKIGCRIDAEDADTMSGKTTQQRPVIAPYVDHKLFAVQAVAVNDDVAEVVQMSLQRIG